MERGGLSKRERGEVRFFLISGFLLWLVATVVVRLVGQYFFSPDDTPALTVLFLLTVPLVVLVAYPLYSYKNVRGGERLLAAVCLALPGMVLDVVSLSFFEAVFPNLSPDAAGYFGAWLLWAYFLVLITGLFPARVRAR